MSLLHLRMLLAAVLAYFLAFAHGADIAYCSPDNTGAETGYQAVYNQFNSDGSCQVKCQDSYAFAVVQGSDCWCSDYAPSDQKQTDLCDFPCPGYQSDWCGSPSAGLYGYIALSIAPSGTIGGASPSTQASSSVSSVSPHPSTRRYHDSSSSSIFSNFTFTSSAVETTPVFGASITTLTSVVSVQSSVQASSSTVETSSAVIVHASSATTSSTTAQSSTFVTSPSATPSPDPNQSTSTPDPSLSPGTTPMATQAITSVTTVTGQVKTIIITPSATADPTLGEGSVNPNGIGKGTVVGIVVGVALGIGLLIGLGVWFCLNRRHANNSIGSSPPFGGSYGSNGTSNPSHSGIPSRQVSQMSSAGLLAGKGPRIQTNGHGLSNGPRSADATLGFSNDRRSLGTDQRLNPYALFAHDEARHSNISLQDNQDYSRQLRVANPDP